jgi:hypothetical protein
VILVECENKGLFEWICLGVMRYGQRQLARKILVKWLHRTWFHKLWNAYNYWYASYCLLACSFNKTSEYTKGENFKKQNVSHIYLLIHSIARKLI